MSGLFWAEVWEARHGILLGVLFAIAIILTWALTKRAVNMAWQRDPKRWSAIAQARINELSRQHRIDRAFIDQLEEDKTDLRARLRGGMILLTRASQIIGGDFDTESATWYRREEASGSQPVRKG